jgi:hypothetical protein
VRDAYRAANAINERVPQERLGTLIPPDEDKQWFLDKVDGEMAHASKLLQDRMPKRDAALDERPISVMIDRSPEWHNFNYVAWILHLHVVVSNQTDGRKEVQGYVWLGGGELLLNPEVMQEVQRREQDRPRLLRHSVLEPSVPESGWIVRAFPYTGGQPPHFTFGVKVENEIYEALGP